MNEPMIDDTQTTAALCQVREMVLEARAAREGAAETRLDLWCERLGQTSHIQEVALDAALSVMSADQGNIQVVEANGLVIKAHRGFSKEFLDYFHVVNDGRTACRAAWKQRRLIHLSDVTDSRIYSRPVLEAMLNDGIRAVVSMPLVTDSGRIVGVLSVHYRHPKCSRDTDLARFRRLATFAANLIDLAGAYAKPNRLLSQVSLK